MTMKAFIGQHEIVTDDDALELMLGTPLDLWLGPAEETGEERAARLDAARDILTEDPELTERVRRAVLLALANLSAELLHATWFNQYTAHRAGRIHAGAPAQEAA
ncbi:hypothetical protein LHJ74_04490 [Streptomyces sp. N2-109]|uniref:Uncharacterized protein n=1 Tax=Streptomyces gossypii TaxID=2883101 RepID=A0ABT2JMU0_9ACTN|nr:hypothetical protein [Streptomyces gossypii]MCT2589197.1 hypothetical protein [Streptomyces gossypii]